MDSPECVRRVAPPTTTIAKTRAQQASSQAAMARRPAAGSAARLPAEESIMVAFMEVMLIGRRDLPPWDHEPGPVFLNPFKLIPGAAA
jgi:hypothetical protein